MQITPIPKILLPPPPENTTKLAINNTTHETIFVSTIVAVKLRNPKALAENGHELKKP